MARIPIVTNYDNDIEHMTMNIAKPCPIEKAYNIVNDKDKFKLINTIKKIVRGSLEYKMYIKFLKDEIDMTCCSFFNNVDTNTNGRTTVKIEIHHEPFTMFDIINIVINKYIKEEIELNPLMIAQDVMKLHYQNLVGLIPLSATVHGLVSDGRLFIPLQCVYGDYVSFITDYYDYIPEDVREVIQTKIQMSKDIESPDMSILEKKYVYLNVDGFNLPQLISKK